MSIFATPPPLVMEQVSLDKLGCSPFVKPLSEGACKLLAIYGNLCVHHEAQMVYNIMNNI